MEVKVTKCANGHYYDTNKYEVCPHCGAGEFATTEPPKKRFGFLGLGKKPTESHPAETKPTSISIPREEPRQGTDLVCEDVETTGTYAPATDLPVEPVQTQGVFSTPTQETLTTGCVLTDLPDAAEDDGVTTGFFAARNEPASPAPVSEPEQPVVPTPVVPAPSLHAQVLAATDDNDAKTTGFFATKTPVQESAAPVSEAEQPAATVSAPAQPPVGWLVCLSGKHIGTDYRLFAGKNSIGRNADNSVCLDGETSVSRDKHAWAIFEPRKQEFFLKPGDESGLVYLNGDNVFDTVPLHDGDVLELGEVKLRFVALCGPSFNWADYMSRG